MNIQLGELFTFVLSFTESAEYLPVLQLIDIVGISFAGSRPGRQNKTLVKLSRNDMLPL